MRSISVSALCLILAAASASFAADGPSDAPQNITIDRATLQQMVRDEVQKEMPGLVQAEVQRQIDARVQQAAKDNRGNAALLVLQTIRGQLELYKIQHHDQFPPLSELADWKALKTATNEDEAYSPRAPYGPYVQSAPQNPFTGKSHVAAAGSATVNDGWSWDEAHSIMRMVLPSAEAPGFVARFGAQVTADIEVAKGQAATAPPADVQARIIATSSDLQTLRGMLELYKIQHDGRYPMMDGMANWTALLKATDRDGQVGTRGEYGPYIRQRHKIPSTANWILPPQAPRPPTPAGRTTQRQAASEQWSRLPLPAPQAMRSTTT